MADNGEKTEKATPKRREEARSEGQLCRSPDLAGALELLAMLFGIKVLGGYIAEGLAEIIRKFISTYALEKAVTKEDLFAISIETGLKSLVIIAPLMALSLVIGLAVNYMQIGIVKMKEPFKIRWEKINPVNGFKGLISPKSLIQLVKSLLKVSILGYVLYNELTKVIPNFPFMLTGNIEVTLQYLVDTIMSIAFKLAGVYIFIGGADYIYQKWDYEKSIMMTKEEIKEEIKQQEGDPKIKGKIKQKQQQMSMLRMMAEVPRADVVITNPTHYAVALKYDEKTSQAPVVIAKGKDFIALKIKEKAKEEKIKMIENKPLAQALYATVDIGQEIPPEFYSAVAEILAEIYKLRRR